MYESSNVGNPLLESIRLNKLILTLDNGGTSEWISHKVTGFIYPVDDVKDLTKTATGHESCVIGKGTIDYKSLLPKVAKHGVQHMIVEQEAYTGTNELDAARDNAAYLKTLKW